MSLLCRMVVIVSLFALAGLLDLTCGTGSFAADLPVVPGHARIQHHPASGTAPKTDTEIRLEEFATGPTPPARRGPMDAVRAARARMACSVRISASRASRRRRDALARSCPAAALGTELCGASPLSARTEESRGLRPRGLRQCRTPTSSKSARRRRESSCALKAVIDFLPPPIGSIGWKASCSQRP